MLHLIECFFLPFIFLSEFFITINFFSPIILLIYFLDGQESFLKFSINFKFFFVGKLFRLNLCTFKIDWVQKVVKKSEVEPSPIFNKIKKKLLITFFILISLNKSFLESNSFFFCQSSSKNNQIIKFVINPFVQGII